MDGTERGLRAGGSQYSGGALVHLPDGASVLVDALLFRDGAATTWAGFLSGAVDDLVDTEIDIQLIGGGRAPAELRPCHPPTAGQVLVFGVGHPPF